MPEKIDFFDDRKVGAEARRLAFCFNLSARMESRDGNPLRHAESLFKESTGLHSIPAFNNEEVAYLKIKLAEIAACGSPAGTLSAQDMSASAELLYILAREMRLIRHTGDSDFKMKPCPDRDEPHISFPGA